MITYTQGNLLDAEAEALVNTVNTVGIMGKGIALMFKEAFPENFKAYEAACKRKEVAVGRMFVTRRESMIGPKWIVNFPTKAHWRYPSRLQWVVDGLQDLRRFIIEEKVQSIAIPPLGAGNGGLNWPDVRAEIDKVLGDLDIDITVFEPTAQYQNVAKRNGVEKLTPARALVAELVRRYWILGIECTLLEIQKLAWFLERSIEVQGLPNKLDLRFEPNRYGPYANRLDHLLNALDGSYLHCDKRIGDASPSDVIWFDDEKKDLLTAYLHTAEAKPYLPALDMTSEVIDGFESPFGMELLATVDWLISRGGTDLEVADIQRGLRSWPAGPGAGERKLKLFNERVLGIAVERLQQTQLTNATN